MADTKNYYTLSKFYCWYSCTGITLCHVCFVLLMLWDMCFTVSDISLLRSWNVCLRL